jgi:peptidoglycan/LPS O-acetylase OafA/YrhL
MNLSAFYAAFSPACFALLGLWLVAVQVRVSDWQGDPERKRRSYGIAMHFALPGLMSVLALVDTTTHTFWRISFIIVGIGGALVLATVRGYPVARTGDRSGLPRPDRLALAAYVAAIVLYLAIAALAAVGGADALRSEAVLQTALIFLGFNAAWLLLLDDRKPAPSTP